MSQIADASVDYKKRFKIVAKSKIRCELIQNVNVIDIYTDDESHTPLLTALRASH